MTTEAGKTTAAPAKESALTKTEGTVSERFTNSVIKEFGSIAGKLVLSPYQKRLAQHLFIKIDASLAELEKKRAEKNKDATQIIWANVNMQKLAIDAVHRIELGLDALIPNHISPIPYWNTRAKKYDLDLRVGYVGKDYYRRQMALDPPDDIIYELVYENDTFRPIKKSAKSQVESYDFEISKPFDRGEVIGGFAYLVYGDPKKNKLIIVTKEDFKKSEAKAQSKDFWNGHPDQMCYKTIVNRATSKLQIDPEKVNASFKAVEHDDAQDEAAAKDEIAENANKGTILDLDPEPGEKAPVPESGREATAGTATQDYSGTIKCPDKNRIIAKVGCKTCEILEGCPAHDDSTEKAQGRGPGF